MSELHVISLTPMQEVSFWEFLRKFVPQPM